MDKYLFEQNRTPARKPTGIKETPEGFLAIEFTESKLISSSQQQKNSIISWINSIIFWITVLPFVLPFAVLFLISIPYLLLILLLIFTLSFLFSSSYRNNIFAKFRLFPGEVILSTYPQSGHKTNIGTPLIFKY